MLIKEDAVIIVPGGRENDPEYPDIVVDLGVILAQQHRQAEVASVTKMKAPELLKTFNESWRNVDMLIKQLTASKIVGEREVEKRRATMLLEEVEGVLTTKKVSSTKDTRDAVIVLDPAFQKLQDRVDKITAMAEFLKGKLKSFENAYASVKKILGEDPSMQQFRHGNPNLSHGAETPRPTSGYQPRQNQPPTVTPLTTNDVNKDINVRPMTVEPVTKPRWGRTS